MTKTELVEKILEILMGNQEIHNFIVSDEPLNIDVLQHRNFLNMFINLEIKLRINNFQKKLELNATQFRTMEQLKKIIENYVIEFFSSYYLNKNQLNLFEEK